MDLPKKVAVLLSGGVDSSVVCLLLKKQGYDVVAITGKMFSSEKSDEIVQNAKKVADMLNIPHYVCDVCDEFKADVIEYYKNSYANGSTPNPCIVCNKKIKWGKIFDFAINELKVDYIATGHYAHILNDNGKYKLMPAADEKKDQLYYLFELNQMQLSKTLFPLSSFKKDEIKQIAIDNNLSSKSSKESQDICFIVPPMTSKKYIMEYLGEKRGNFVLKSENKILGTHNGSWQYTIGQRKGIGLAYKEPLYVIDIDITNNIVYLGIKDELYSSSVILNKLNFSVEEKNSEFSADVKIRYNMSKVSAVLKPIDGQWHCIFNEPVSAITKGQALVIYDQNDGHLVGGGWI